MDNRIENLEQQDYERRKERESVEFDAEMPQLYGDDIEFIPDERGDDELADEI